MTEMSFLLHIYICDLEEETIKHDFNMTDFTKLIKSYQNI